MWIKKEPTFGDQIRVNRGFYYHHGIYASNDCVIQFANPNPDDSEIDPSKAVICTTTLEKFLKGGAVEVREYTELEKKKLRPKNEIVNYALSRLGEGGYNLINNNCEHFSNECAFGEKISEQVNNIFSFFVR